jgi:TPR repeat protein|tara:strand:- start:1197 stop:1439 length:243 start_codon:yes stop_codon:yes gene_type:complete
MKKLVTALFLIFATAVWAGDFEDGVAAYEKGDYKTALSFFKKAAEQGDSYAQNNLALMYNEGKGVLKRRCRSSSLVQVGS